MIKKILITVFTITGLLFGIGNTAFVDLGQFYVSETNEDSVFQGYTYYVSNDGNFETSTGENTVKTFTRTPNMENRNRIFNLGWINGNLYFYDYFRAYDDPIQTVQGFLNKWCIAPVSDRGNNPNGYLHSNCSFVNSLDQIKQLSNNFSNYVFEVYGSTDPSWAGYDYLSFMFCLSDGSNDYCVQCGNNSCPSGLTGSLNLNLGDFTNISSYNWGNSPFSSNIIDGSIGNGGIELNSTESALNYFERYYGWDENICYVGVDNVTDLWGSSVSFEEGSGLDIFDTFELLYGNTELTRMYVWMNSWLINYNQWFQNPEDRLYLANYNSGTNQVDLYYDNLTYPFNNQPVALYFMADNISNYTNRQTMGSDVVSYCYLKLKGGTFEDIIENSTKQSINQYTENYNTNKGLNSDGSVKDIDYSLFGSFQNDIAFSGDTSLKNSLENFFSKINDLITGINVSSNYNILPSWLVTAFLFVVLFRLIRKK